MPNRKRKPCQSRRFERLERRAMLSVSGDFNGDGFDDLAIGVPREDLGPIVNTGAVHVIYGSRKGLAAAGDAKSLNPVNNQFWTQDSPGVNGVAANGDLFGAALAAGDFNGDGFDDLAIGTPGKTVNGQIQAGAVNVLYGSSTGLRAGTVDQQWTQDSSGINDTAEAGDLFGSALVTGDFNGDGRDDLAIGVLNESVGSIVAAGAVNVLYGSATGLTNVNDQNWHQNSTSIDGIAEANDNFSSALAAGDFNGDGRDDLAIGVPADRVGSVVQAGAVNVIYGSSTGLSRAGDQLLHQDTANVTDDPEANDQFGLGLAAGDFDADGFDDLAIGAPNESRVVGPDTINGIVHVLDGSANKLVGVANQDVFRLFFAGLDATATFFGEELASGDFDNDGFDDLAIGLPFATVNGKGAAGVVAVAYSGGNNAFQAGGLRHEVWHQDQPGINGVTAANDNFGNRLTSGDYDGDGRCDLAIGITAEDIGSAQDAGAVAVLYGFLEGLTEIGDQLWSQGSGGIADTAETGDRFGSALA